MTPIRPTRGRWRRSALLTALALISATTFGLIAPAHANEFQPKPTAAATTTCDGGPAFHVELGNVDGLATATFDISILDTTVPNGVPTTSTEQLVPGDTTSIDYPQTQGHTAHLVVSSGQVTLADVTHAFDCSQPLTGTITVECDIVPRLRYLVTNTDVYSHDISLEVPDLGTVDESGLKPGGTVSLGYPMTEGAHVQGSISDAGTVIATFDGTIDCEDPSASITLDCSTGQPVLDYVLVEDRLTQATFVPSLDGVDDAPVVVNTYLPASTLTVTKTLTEDAPFDASVTDQQVGTTLAHLTGVADCQPPEPVPTTAPPSTVAVDPSTTEAPATTEAPTTTARPAEVLAVTTQPSFTG